MKQLRNVLVLLEQVFRELRKLRTYFSFRVRVTLIGNEIAHRLPWIHDKYVRFLVLFRSSNVIIWSTQSLKFAFDGVRFVHLSKLLFLPITSCPSCLSVRQSTGKFCGRRGKPKQIGRGVKTNHGQLAVRSFNFAFIENASVQVLLFINKLLPSIIFFTPRFYLSLYITRVGIVHTSLAVSMYFWYFIISYVFNRMAWELLY